MNVLWVFVHPEQRSLNSSLRDEGVSALEAAGHEVRVSDLYAMKWKAVVDRDDFGDEGEDRLIIGPASGRAYRTGTLSADIRAEQEKIEWADTVILQFPIWWYGMPAILKGWFDRVFVMGFGYAINDPEHPGRARRYGDGHLRGKRAFAVVTSGSSEASLGPRGIHGPLDHLLFALLHGTLWYAGMTVIPPFVTYLSDWLGDEEYRCVAARLRERMTSLENTEPLPFRHQNGGHYDEELVLRPDILTGDSGLQIHYDSP
jgi:NAD(P)H dehydrogenase (quinone)